MKWLALVLILLLIVIVFGIWRRLQADHARRAGAEPPSRAVIEPPAPSQNARPTTQSAATTSQSAATTTPAAEAGADEVPRGPAHEEHPGAADSTTRRGTESRSPSEAPPPADPWWGDDASDKPT